MFTYNIKITKFHSGQELINVSAEIGSLFS